MLQLTCRSVMSTLTQHPNHFPQFALDRRASWFELFFDLVFVVAVAQLNGAYVDHFDLAGAAQFAFGFLAMWWCWLGHTFYATRFDQDLPTQRTLGLLLILTVAWLGYGAADYAGDLHGVFASGIASFKLLMVAAYALAWRWPAARPMIRFYGTVYLLQAALWLLSMDAAPAIRWSLWSAALLLDVVSPWLAGRFAHEIPPHAEHLPERFGLFTIILLGESVASAVHALGHGAEPALEARIAAVGGTLLTFMVWVAYFERTRAHQGRHIATAHDGLKMRLWAFAHLPLYLGIASLAAGTVYLSRQALLQPDAQGVFTGGVSMIMVGLLILSAAQSGEGRIRFDRRMGLQLLLAVGALFALATLGFVQPVYLLITTGGAFVLQLVAASERAVGGH